MAELISTKLHAEQHLLLDQPLLRVPFELTRKNFAQARRHIEKTSADTLAALNAAATAAPEATPDQTLASLDAMIAKAQTLKRKLEALHAEEEMLHRHQRARIQHLQELHDIPNLADVKYDEWSKVRLDRMLVDYLLRQGYTRSADQLAKEKKIEDLVDVQAFIECSRIEASLQNGRTQECLAWCSENKQTLKKINSNLELELRLQQFIELVRTGEPQKLIEATLHARKHLGTHQNDSYGLRAGGLLANPPHTRTEPYKVAFIFTMYSTARWPQLAELFVKTHHEIFSLPPRPLLHIALSAGLSALKTPACHSHYASSSSNASSSTTSVCPICSTELNALARSVPYAHHSKSYVEDDPVMLPNGRIYGRGRLMALNEKIGTAEGKVRDPTDLSLEFNESDIKKVYIS
ncbi:protein FYV10 [Aureobasidium pullulans]|uniref:Protein FYV10 n=1 Tax=Aureobasidium pullulans TaxID=5580 RepID=A0A4S9DB68_AURPU|nr:protein FYV10 [Aureobasidium pullulans]THY80206.1 protein FYV10 [Aureobasidium pullulans]THY80666.1 protein FYV10 [Aureobasidium pullulans]